MLIQRIFCFGDSVTFGERDLEFSGWVSRLNRLFFQQMRGASIIPLAAYNLGIGGETTDGLKKRFENELSARRLKNSKTTVLFQYGLNDMVLHKGKNRVPLTYFKRNLVACIQYSLERKLDVGLITIHPFSESLDNKVDCFGHIRSLTDVGLYNEALYELAALYGCQLIDVEKIFRAETMLAEDAIHPNALGHQAIAGLIEEQLFARQLSLKGN
jgi:lysophospholipase L1-like esterase